MEELPTPFPWKCFLKSEFCLGPPSWIGQPADVELVWVPTDDEDDEELNPKSWDYDAANPPAAWLRPALQQANSEFSILRRLHTFC